MSRTHVRFPLLSVVLAAAITAPVLFMDAPSAHADVGVRIRGNVKIRVGSPAVRVRVHGARPRVRPVYVRHRRLLTQPPPPRLQVGGAVYVGGGIYVGGFAEPPPPPVVVHDCDPAPVPNYYEPAEPLAPPPVEAVAPALPPLPRWGIGVFAGSTEAANGMAGTSGEDAGLLGRLRLTDAFLIEAEIGKNQVDEFRVDRRVGGALILDLAPRSRLSAHLLAGLGLTQIDAGEGAWRADQEYGELGAGLRYRLSPRFEVAADLRAGARASVDDASQDDALKALAPSSASGEGYTRGRLSAVLYF